MMEMMMQSDARITDEMLTELIRRRWARFQTSRWPSGAVQTAALNSLDVDVDERTVNGWRQGQLPSNKHRVRLIRAGFGVMLDRAYEPASSAGRISELEARIEQEKSAIRAAERELKALRQAFED